MQADIEHFRTKLGKINGAVEIGDKLLEVVQAKATTAPASTSEPEAEPASETQAQSNGSDSAES